MHFISWLDYVLLPIYLTVLFLFARSFRDRKYPKGHPWRPYFIPALWAKVGGAIFIGLIYQYYYGGGDTGYYFLQSNVLNEAFSKDPWTWLQLVLHVPNGYEGPVIDYVSRMEWYPPLNNYAVIAISGVFGLLTFNTYLPVSVLFAFLSFTGVWAMFRTFATQYPKLVKPVAMVLLFIPSTVIWGSGIFKDTICMFGMGWLLYGLFSLLIQRKIRLGALVLACIGFYLIAIIKVYILLALLPALGLWILFYYSQQIKLGLVRVLLKTVLFAGSILIFLSFSDKFAEEMGQYSLEKIANTATVTRDYIYSSSGDEGSAYSLGSFDLSAGGMLKLFLPAVNVSLFRPYLWEARKPIIFLNALEAALFLFFTLKLLFTLGPLKIWEAITEDPNIQFCLIFSIIFAFSVGLTSANFGSLSRYRIPALPLYGLALVLIYYTHNDSRKPFLRFWK